MAVSAASWLDLVATCATPPQLDLSLLTVSDVPRVSSDRSWRRCDGNGLRDSAGRTGGRAGDSLGSQSRGRRTTFDHPPQRAISSDRGIAGFDCRDQRPCGTDGADWLVAAIPTAHLRTTLAPLAPHVGAGVPIASVVKGIEQRTFDRPSQILREVLGPRPVVALCGPSHAEEMSRLLPTSVVAASDDAKAAKAAQTLFNTDRFRVYTNEDLVGVEWAGALKNVVAIAAGVCDGLGYGDNAKAALLTRACVEMSRFGAKMGASPDTFLGLAGIGDLMTSCFSPMVATGSSVGGSAKERRSRRRFPRFMGWPKG